jgi:hypothetical protein
MAKRILQVIGNAYRGTLEEQDDTVVWLTHALRGAGVELDVLLRGNAVNYLVRAQDASGLAFGAKRQTQPPRLHEDVSKLLTKGVDVRYVEEDAQERCLGRGELIEGPRPIARNALAALFGAYRQIWCW